LRAVKSNACRGGTIWAADDPERFSPATRELLRSETVNLYLSAATIWELLIKVRKKKLDFGGDPVSKLWMYCHRLRTVLLAVSSEHPYRAFALEGLRKDPFDRLLIAQAQAERLPLVTRDRTVEQYNVETIW
jgi:PIN domain nuclease of toxin-antitoxin system